MPAVDELLFSLKEKRVLILMEENLSLAMIALRQGKRDIVVHYTPSGIVVYAHPQRMERAYMLAGYLQGAFRREGLLSPGLSVEVRAIELPQFRQIDYFLPGVLAMVIMQLGLFGSLDFVSLRERKIIRQLQATPLKKEWLLWSEIAVHLVIAFVQTAVILASGWLFFRVRISFWFSTGALCMDPFWCLYLREFGLLSCVFRKNSREQPGCYPGGAVPHDVLLGHLFPSRD